MYGNGTGSTKGVIEGLWSQCQLIELYYNAQAYTTNTCCPMDVVSLESVLPME
jgi:hypothetical protein